jgi:hypothetical protein
VGRPPIATIAYMDFTFWREDATLEQQKYNRSASIARARRSIRRSGRECQDISFLGQANLRSFRRQRRRRDHGSHERSDGPGVCCGQEDLYSRHDDSDANPCTSSKPGAMPVDTAPEPRDMILWDNNNIYRSKGARTGRGLSSANASSC